MSKSSYSSPQRRGPPATNYLPFGDGASCTGTIQTWNQPQYTGQWDDIETNLDHMAQRYYSPVEARWTTPDPAGVTAADQGSPQSWNRYSYVENNPIGNIDPQGTDACSMWGSGCSAHEGPAWDEFDIVALAFTPTKAYLYINPEFPATEESDGIYFVYGRIGLLGLLGQRQRPPDPSSNNPQLSGGCVSCHVPNYRKPLSCDVDKCTPQQRAQWCADAQKMSGLGLKVTGQSGLGPVVSVGLGNLAIYIELLAGPLTVVANVQGNAAYMANYVDSVCKGD